MADIYEKYCFSSCKSYNKTKCVDIFVYLMPKYTF